MTELKEAKTNNNDNTNDEYNGWFPSWNLANNKGCFNAEQNLVKAFVDKGIKSESKQIKINFDATPQSQLKKNQKLDHNKIEYIHTLSFKVTKQFFKNQTKTDNNNNNNNNDSNNNDSNNNEQKIENKTGIEEHWHKRELSKSNLYSHTMSDLDKYIIKHLNKNNNNDGNTIKTKMDPIVLLHGYGSASGMYIHTINTIFKTLYMLLSDNIELYPIIYVLDWLGNGQSSRPQFKCKDCGESETFFIESLEEWRNSMKINKFVYIGHSLGGYLGVVYTIKYGIHVSKLILVSPAGIPIKPDNVDPLAHMNLSWKGKLLFNTFKNIVWNTGLTPHDFFRMIGSKSKTLIPELIEKRLFRLKNNNNNSTINNELFKKLLGEYMFHVICQKGSGEYALNKILLPGGPPIWGVNPLYNRFKKLKFYQNNNNLEIDFVYGKTDWMDSKPAMQLKLNNIIKANIYTVPDGGHQLILENGHYWATLISKLIIQKYVSQ